MEIRKHHTDDSKFAEWQEDEKKIVELSDEMHPIDDTERLSNKLYACIDKLKDEQKDCINLFYFKKKCYREIAKILRTEEKDIKSNIQNAKRNLKICLEKKHDRKKPA
jgi:RNA polymerase sigma-70 factor (ECF subfamily)